MSKVYNKPPMLQLMQQLYDIAEPAPVVAFSRLHTEDFERWFHLIGSPGCCADSF